MDDKEILEIYSQLNNGDVDSERNKTLFSLMLSESSELTQPVEDYFNKFDIIKCKEKQLKQIAQDIQKTFVGNRGLENLKNTFKLDLNEVNEYLSKEINDDIYTNCKCMEIDQDDFKVLNSRLEKYNMEQNRQLNMNDLEKSSTENQSNSSIKRKEHGFDHQKIEKSNSTEIVGISNLAINSTESKTSFKSNKSNSSSPYGGFMSSTVKYNEDCKNKGIIPNLNVGKKLGGKVSGGSKFVPPLLKENLSEEKINDKPEIDERLRNVEPQMIQRINDEVLVNFDFVEWDEIAGLESAKATIKEAVVYPLLRPDIFTGLRRPPRGILLFGPPGTGKTLIGKCIASQSKSTFFSISSSSLTSKWIGDGEKMVRALFAVAAIRAPSVIFIDEIDSLLCQRSDTEHEASRRMKTEFLVQLDGAGTSSNERILIIGATNRPQELDDAARRRLVRRLYIPLPELEARIQILKNLCKTVKNNLSIDDYYEIAKMTDGFSGADMKQLCTEAAMEPIRISIRLEDINNIHEPDLSPVNIDHFNTIFSKVRPSVSKNDLHQYIEWNKLYGSGTK